MNINANITYRQHGGKWEYRIRYIDPITKKPKEKSKRGFAGKKEAKFMAEKVQVEIQDGYDQSDITLAGYLDLWMRDYKDGNVSKNYLSSLNNSIENHIKPYFKQVELKAVTPEMYQKFINYLSKEKGQARNTVLKAHNCLYNCMKQAKRNKRIKDNPCEDVVIPGKRKQEEDASKFIDSDDVPNLLSHAYQYGYIYWIFFKVLIETGMRKGEAAALQWSDINLKEKTIYINKSLDFQPETEEELFGDTKNYKSRTIEIPDTTASALKSHLNFQNQNKLMLNELYRHDLNLVLCRKDGDHMPKSTLFNAFERILKRAELDSHPIHSLRHTYVVILMEAGVDLKYIQQQLGHGSQQITNDVYVHLSKKLKKKNTDQVNSRLNDVFKGITQNASN